MKPDTTTKPGSIAVRILNYGLLISFALTNMVPLTGIHIHKMASTLFLLLTLVHTAVNHKKLTGKRLALLLAVGTAFFSGLFGMIFDRIPLILALHRAVSIGCVFFLAIHIFVFQRGLRICKRGKNI